MNEKLLTPSERDIHNLLRYRRTPKQIAKAKGISLAAVYCHKSNIKKKFGFTLGPKIAPELQKLSPRQREAFALSRYGHSQKEIAGIMQINEQSVNTLLYRARIRQRAKEKAEHGTINDPMFQ